MDIAKIIDLKNRYHLSREVIDFTTGVLTFNGRKYDVIAVCFDGVLTDNDISKLNALKQVVKVGSRYYKYAPEIVNSVVYIKK